jgi:hypothetical protein
MAEFFKWYKQLNKHTYYIFIRKGRPTNENTMMGWSVNDMGTINLRTTWNRNLFREKNDKEHKTAYKVSKPEFIGGIDPRRVIIKDFFDAVDLGEI